MTRKHFRILADALGRDMWDPSTTEPFTEDEVRERYGYTINAMYECNPAFDCQKFVDEILRVVNMHQNILNEV
jgi:hypothetical protein